MGTTLQKIMKGMKGNLQIFNSIRQSFRSVTTASPISEKIEGVVLRGIKENQLDSQEELRESSPRETSPNVYISLPVQFTNKQPIKVLQPGFLPYEDSSTKRFYSYALPARETLFRTLFLPKVSNKEFPTLLRSALESTFSLPLDDFEISWEKKKGKDTQNKSSGEKVTCFLTPKTVLVKAYDDLISQNCNPAYIFPKALALSQAATFYKVGQTPLILLDVDGAETVLVLLHNGLIIDTKSVDGIHECRAESSWKPLREIARILLAWQEHFPYSQSAPLYISGLLNSQDEVILLNFLKRTAFQIHVEESTVLPYLPALGAALLAHESDLLRPISGYQLDSCQREEVKQWIKPLCLMVSLFLLVALLGLGIGHTFLSNQQGKLNAQFKQLINLTYAELPSNIAQNPQSLDELAESLDQIDDQLKAHDLYPISPDIPKLSEVIHWLTTVAGNCSKEQDAPPIELAMLQYNMLKRPDKTRPRERYQVRVDVEFTAGNATQARKFHEELLAPNPFIDPRLEVKWSLSGGKWRASFFLKDKTVYFP